MEQFNIVVYKSNDILEAFSKISAQFSHATANENGQALSATMLDPSYLYFEPMIVFFCILMAVTFYIYAVRPRYHADHIEYSKVFAHMKGIKGFKQRKLAFRGYLNKKLLEKIIYLHENPKYYKGITAQKSNKILMNDIKRKGLKIEELTPENLKEKIGETNYYFSMTKLIREYNYPIMFKNLEKFIQQCMMIYAENSKKKSGRGFLNTFYSTRDFFNIFNTDYKYSFITFGFCMYDEKNEGFSAKVLNNYVGDLEMSYPEYFTGMKTMEALHTKPLFYYVATVFLGLAICYLILPNTIGTIPDYIIPYIKIIKVWIICTNSILLLTFLQNKKLLIVNNEIPNKKILKESMFNYVVCQRILLTISLVVTIFFINKKSLEVLKDYYVIFIISAIILISFALYNDRETMVHKAKFSDDFNQKIITSYLNCNPKKVFLWIGISTFVLVLSVIQCNKVVKQDELGFDQTLKIFEDFYQNEKKNEDYMISKTTLGKGKIESIKKLNYPISAVPKSLNSDIGENGHGLIIFDKRKKKIITLANYQGEINSQVKIFDH